MQNLNTEEDGKLRLFVSVETKLDMVLEQFRSLREHLDKSEETLIWTRADVNELKAYIPDIKLIKEQVAEAEQEIIALKKWVSEQEAKANKVWKWTWIIVGGLISVVLGPVLVWLLIEWIRRLWQ